jgi:hypothetical protein
MSFRTLGKTLFALALLAAVGGIAWAAGYTTNGLPTTSAQLTGNELIAADTQLPSGQTPQSEAISVNQIKNYDANAAILVTGQAAYTNQLLLYHTFYLTATSNFTLNNPTGPQDGGTYRWIITQGGSGSNVASYGSAFTFAGSSTLSTTAGYVDILTCLYDGPIASYLCTVTLHYH